MNTIGKAYENPWGPSINNNLDNSTTKTEQPQADRWTIKRLLDWTTEYFQENGAGQPRLDAEVLLAEALQCKRIELYTRFDEEPADETKARFRDWVGRHAKGEPVAYLAGNKEFFSLKFKVDNSVLIPRPESEHLVTECLDAIKAYSESGRESIDVVDVGTGSGCIVVAIAKHVANANLIATDISSKALAIATQNATIHGVADRIEFVESNLLAGVDSEKRFDIIVSNPPYIGLSEKDALDVSVVGFEPHVALFSDGPDGTEIIQRMLAEAVSRLNPGGKLMFELSPMIAEKCKLLVDETNGLTFDRFVNDLAGHKRLIIASREA